jgi:hypothetical protein
VHLGVGLGNLKETAYLEDPDVVGRIILKLIFWMWDGMVWSGLFWLRSVTGGRLFFMWY